MAAMVGSVLLILQAWGTCNTNRRGLDNNQMRAAGAMLIAFIIACCMPWREHLRGSLQQDMMRVLEKGMAGWPLLLGWNGEFKLSDDELRDSTTPDKTSHMNTHPLSAA
jgi:hypothetical protein